jgi:16S rRNA C967 or C1407 C5-methylase (RsmB/RsmF family)
MASSWAARSERTEASMGVVNDWLMTWTNPRPGQVVLDVTAGPGGLSELET